MKPLSPLAAAIPVLWLATTLQDAPAQEVPAPASQLKKFEPFIGDWQVSGTMRATADAPETPWTARESLRWALGGHFVQQELLIEFGEAMPSLAFTGFMGWDNEHQRYVSLGASNLGEVAHMEPQFPDDNTMIVARTGFMEGQLMVERNILKIGDGTYSFEIEMAMGDGPFFTTVKGTATRSAARGQALAVEATMSMAPPAAEMATFEKFVGESDIVGTMIPAPGAPEMPITGTETFSMIMGGTVMKNRVIGDAGPGAPPYEGIGFTAWNPVDQCYDMISVDNMGMSGKAQLRDMGNGVFVGTASAMMYGQPTVTRTILTCDAQGIPVSVVADSIAGTGDVQRVFSGKYSRK